MKCLTMSYLNHPLQLLSKFNLNFTWFNTTLIRNQTHRWYGAGGAAVLFDFMLDITSKQPLSFRGALQTAIQQCSKIRWILESFTVVWKLEINPVFEILFQNFLKSIFFLESDSMFVCCKQPQGILHVKGFCGRFDDVIIFCNLMFPVLYDYFRWS